MYTARLYGSTGRDYHPKPSYFVKKAAAYAYPPSGAERPLSRKAAQAGLLTQGLMSAPPSGCPTPPARPSGFSERIAAGRELVRNHLPLLYFSMNALALVSVLSMSSLALSSAAPPPPAAPAATTEMVTVVVTALASTHSVVKLNFYNDPSKFLKAGQMAIRLLVRPEGKTSISVPVELAPGEWAVALSQDTNDNDKLDKNFLGIPTEPYAFSNNVRPRFAAPNFEECKFTVAGPGQVISIALK